MFIDKSPVKPDIKRFLTPHRFHPVPPGSVLPITPPFSVRCPFVLIAGIPDPTGRKKNTISLSARIAFTE
jgi:hypothetical protein